MRFTSAEGLYSQGPGAGELDIEASAQDIGLVSARPNPACTCFQNIHVADRSRYVKGAMCCIDTAEPSRNVYASEGGPLW
jgi:hypothetical protein